MTTPSAQKWVNLYTKEQLLVVLNRWNVNEPPPAKGKKVMVAFPPQATFNLGIVTRSEHKSTYGKPLFRVELSNV